MLLHVLRISSSPSSPLLDVALQRTHSPSPKLCALNPILHDQQHFSHLTYLYQSTRQPTTQLPHTQSSPLHLQQPSSPSTSPIPPTKWPPYQHHPSPSSGSPGQTWINSSTSKPTAYPKSPNGRRLKSSPNSHPKISLPYAVPTSALPASQKLLSRSIIPGTTPRLRNITW